MAQGLLIIEASWLHSDTPSLIDSSGRMISPTQRTLPDNTQHSQQRDIHAPCRIRTHNPNKRAAADPRLRQHGHWNLHFSFLMPKYSPHLFVLGRPQSVFSLQNLFCWQICFPIWGSTNKVLLHSGFVDVNNSWLACWVERFPAPSLRMLSRSISTAEGFT